MTSVRQQERQPILISADRGDLSGAMRMCGAIDNALRISDGRTQS